MVFSRAPRFVVSAVPVHVTDLCPFHTWTWMRIGDPQAEHPRLSTMRGLQQINAEVDGRFPRMRPSFQIQGSLPPEIVRGMEVCLDVDRFTHVKVPLPHTCGDERIVVRRRAGESAAAFPEGYDMFRLVGECAVCAAASTRARQPPEPTDHRNRPPRIIVCVPPQLTDLSNELWWGGIGTVDVCNPHEAYWVMEGLKECAEGVRERGGEFLMDTRLPASVRSELRRDFRRSKIVEIPGLPHEIRCRDVILTVRPNHGRRGRALIEANDLRLTSGRCDHCRRQVAARYLAGPGYLVLLEVDLS